MSKVILLPSFIAILSCWIFFSPAVLFAAAIEALI